MHMDLLLIPGSKALYLLPRQKNNNNNNKIKLLAKSKPNGKPSSTQVAPLRADFKSIVQLPGPLELHASLCTPIALSQHQNLAHG